MAKRTIPSPGKRRYRQLAPTTRRIPLESDFSILNLRF